MDKSIGIVHYKDDINHIVRPLLLLSAAYHVPVYFYNAANIDPERENPLVPGFFWNGASMETKEIEVPIYSENMMFRQKHIASRYLNEDQYNWVLRHTKMTDSAGINKQDLPRILLSSPYAECAIPTYFVSSYEKLQALAQVMPVSIVKPSGGRLGLGVLHLDLKDGVLMCRSSQKTRPMTPEVWQEYLEYLSKNKFGQPIFQPRLNFTLDDRHALDFRLLVARGANGDWETVSISARIGSTNLVSNVARGGFACGAMDALTIIAGDKAETLMDKLRQLTVDLPRLIQSHCKNTITSIGFDIGIHRDTLQPYLLEANTNPGTYLVWELSEVRVQYYGHLLSQL